MCSNFLFWGLRRGWSIMHTIPSECKRDKWENLQRATFIKVHLGQTTHTPRHGWTFKGNGVGPIILLDFHFPWGTCSVIVGTGGEEVTQRFNVMRAGVERRAVYARIRWTRCSSARWPSLRITESNSLGEAPRLQRAMASSQTHFQSPTNSPSCYRSAVIMVVNGVLLIAALYAHNYFYRVNRVMHRYVYVLQRQFFCVVHEILFSPPSIWYALSFLHISTPVRIEPLFKYDEITWAAPSAESCRVFCFICLCY